MAPRSIIASGGVEYPANKLTFKSSEAAAYIGVSLATIRRWTDGGHIDCYRTPGGQRRFSREHLDSFIVSLEHATVNRPPADDRSQGANQAA